MTKTRQQIVFDIAGRIAAIRLSHPTRVAIDGVDAAGKTVLAEELATAIERLGRPVIRASIDGFHNPKAIRHRNGSLSPEGYFQDSFNHPSLIEFLLQPLGPAGSLLIRRTVFDFRTDKPLKSETEKTPSDSVLLFDGVFLLRPELREYFDYSVLVQADFATTLKRAEQRDLHLFNSIEEVRRRYRERYIPGQKLYLNTVHSERWASIILTNNDPTAPKIENPSKNLWAKRGKE